MPSGPYIFRLGKAAMHHREAHDARLFTDTMVLKIVLLQDSMHNEKVGGTLFCARLSSSWPLNEGAIAIWYSTASYMQDQRLAIL